MAIIYSYPPNSNILPTDILICTSTVLVSGKPKNQTKSISIQNLTSYVNTSSTNNLDQVLSNGNYSLLFANIGQLGLFDTSENDYALLKISDSEFIFEDVNGIATSQSRRGITLLGDGVHYGSIYLPPYTTSHQYDLPDNTGTIALTSDLSAYVPYTGATQAVDLGAFNLTVNGISVGKGSGTGLYNTAVGFQALSSNTTANGNTAVGFNALKSNTTGTNNVAIGESALSSSTSGNDNIAIGYKALTTSSSSTSNTAIGLSAGEFTTTGYHNVFLGWYAGRNNTTGRENTFLGYQGGYFNITGNGNTLVGFYASRLSTTATQNASLGYQSLGGNTTGSFNSLVGYQALQYLSTGQSNVAMGWNAGSVQTGGGGIANNPSNSVYIGYDTRSPLNNQTNQIVIGHSAIGAGSNTVTLGNTAITTTRLRGAVQGGSFVKDSGTAIQYLMADGSTTTAGPLFKSANSIGGTGVVSVISSAIVGSLFPDGSILKIQTMVTFGPSQTLNITPITYYINTSPSLVGAIQIATYDISVGQRYAWMDRSFWSIANTFNSRNFLNSSQTSVSNSGSTLGSTSIPATFYIIASMNVGAGDLGTISSMIVEKI